ncbi:MAG: response regulator, partial [Rhodothermales bacterium]|nr:response regulator [Rhodothermales bacterium]
MVLLLCVFAGFIYWLRFRALKARQRSLERTVAERTSDLVAAKEQIEAQANSLKALDRFKTRFFNNISHEFRTPLTLTIGPLENALTGTYGQLGPAMRAQVEIMLRNSRRLLRLINQLLDLAKLESGKMALRARKGNAVDFVEGIVYSFTAFATERGIELSCHTDIKEPDLFYDSEKIEKVIFNLLSNAVKFTVSGSIDVILKDVAETDEVEISVKDTGPGIDERDLPFLFDRYRQVDGTVSRIQDGTGIGLSLVKELVDLHRGRVAVESELGVGSTFSVFLKRGSAHFHAEQLATDSDDSEQAKSAPQNSMAEMVVADPDEIVGRSRFVFDESKIKPGAPHLLVVDDNADIRDYVKTCLYPNYWVHDASNGVGALAKLETIEVDLVISDIMMPEMDGYELANKIKTNPAYSHIPVIFLTAKASTDRKVEGLEMGADDYVSKPFNARE